MDKSIKEIKIIGHVDTSLPDPWRTKEEYDKDQRTLLRSYRWSVAASLAAIATAVCTIILASVAIFEIRNMTQELPSKIRQQEPVEMPSSQIDQK